MLESLIRELIILGVYLIIAGVLIGASVGLAVWGIWVWVG